MRFRKFKSALVLWQLLTGVRWRSPTSCIEDHQAFANTTNRTPRAGSKVDRDALFLPIAVAGGIGSVAAAQFLGRGVGGSLGCGDAAAFGGFGQGAQGRRGQVLAVSALSVSACLAARVWSFVCHRVLASALPSGYIPRHRCCKP